MTCPAGEQGDQIERIGRNFWLFSNAKVDHPNWCTFSKYYFYEKCVGRQFGRYFNKIISGHPAWRIYNDDKLKKKQRKQGSESLHY
jgi:hypothetical protein